MQFEIIDIFPKCSFCRHKVDGAAKCSAFPDLIPEEIRNGEHNHSKPYPGDNGIRFELKEGEK